MSLRVEMEMQYLCLNDILKIGQMTPFMSSWLKYLLPLICCKRLSHYQAALRINPQNEAAKKGLERLEKQMKGVDPDAPEEDEENEVEDADGEQEETDLLQKQRQKILSLRIYMK